MYSRTGIELGLSPDGMELVMCAKVKTEACLGGIAEGDETLRWLEMQAFHLRVLSIFVPLLEKSVMLSASWGLLGCSVEVWMCGNCRLAAE